MAVYRVDLLCDDPGPVFDWLEEEITSQLLVRKIGYETVKGWHMKVVFKRQEDAEKFHRRFYPDATDHSVAAFVSQAIEGS